MTQSQIIIALVKKCETARTKYLSNDFSKGDYIEDLAQWDKYRIAIEALTEVIDDNNRMIEDKAITPYEE